MMASGGAGSQANAAAARGRHPAFFIYGRHFWLYALRHFLSAGLCTFVAGAAGGNRLAPPYDRAKEFPMYHIKAN